MYKPHKSRQLACGTIASGFAANCDTAPVAGLEVDVWLMNREDINLSGCTITGRKISVIALASLKEMYKFTGFKSSNNSAINLNLGKYKNNWIHTMGMIVFDNTPDTKTNIIEKLADANLVAIVRNKWKGAASAHEFEVLGWSVGLEASVSEKKSDDTDTQGAWKLTLASPKDQYEDNAGYIIDYGSQASTLAAIEALTDTGS